MNQYRYIRLSAISAALGWQLLSALPLLAAHPAGHVQHHSDGEHAHEYHHGTGHHEGVPYHGDEMRRHQGANINVNGGGQDQQPIIIDGDTSQDQADQTYDSYQSQGQGQ